MKSFGFLESGLKKDDLIYSSPSKVNIPASYSLPIKAPVYDQGSHGSCVSCSLAEGYYWFMKNQMKDWKPDYEFVYRERADKSVDGMMPREAYEILRRKGLIQVFARIPNLETLKESIIINGAALIGLIAKSDSETFWKGTDVLGGHAVAVTGFNSTGLEIKNSWGTNWGRSGYTVLPYEDFSYVREAWTILA